MKFKVIEKAKYNTIEPWWSMIKNEINNEELWFVDDGLIKNEPSYKPRKIDRTLESINTEYTGYVFELNNMYDFKRIQLLLFKQDIIWVTGDNTIKSKYDDLDLEDEGDMVFPFYIFIDMKRKNFFYRPSDDLDYNDPILTLKQNITDRLNISKIIYSINDFNRIFKTEPSYKPRKIERFLERRNNIENAKEITILIKSNEEIISLDDAIKPLGIQIPEGLMITNYDTPTNIFIHIESGIVTYTILLDYQRKNWENLELLDGVYKKEFTIDDLPHIIRILREKKILPLSPNYNPKKIDRTLESINESVMDSFYFTKYDSLIIIIDEELNEERIDYFTDLFNKVFNSIYQLSFKHIFENFLGYEENSSYIAIRRSGIGWNTIENLEENNINKDSTFPKYFKLSEVDTLNKINSILNHGGIIPSYEPKKIDRSIDESADYLEVKKDGKYITLEYLQKDAIPFAFDEDDNLVIGENGTAHSDFFIKEFKDNFRNDYYISPKEYQEKFGKISPIKIPIEDIEEFYDIEFKDYYTDLYSDETVNRLEDYKFIGRLWLNPKIISFWDYPMDNEEMKEVINRIEKRLDINIWNDQWLLSITDKNGNDSLIPIADYEKSENPSKEEWINHIKSPFLKQKKVPKGWGSEHPDYQKKRAWQMASLTSENKLVNLRNKLYESPDEINDYDRKLLWNSDGSYAFGYYKGKLYISPETRGHGSMGPEDERKTKYFDRNDFKFAGRIWKYDKILSFWFYPNKEEFKQILKDLSNELNININNSWEVELSNGKIINIEDYSDGGIRSEEDLSKQHLLSPLLKSKRIPQGWGSNHPDYKKKRDWQMASLTSENSDYGDMYERLYNGRYNAVVFTALDNQQRNAVKDYILNNNNIDIDCLYGLNNSSNKNFLILFNNRGISLNQYHLYTLSRPEIIGQFLKESFNFSGTLSPILNYSEFINYIKSFNILPAELMYKPKKIDKSI